MNLMDSMLISASGMKAQGTRLRVISENVANADSGPQYEGGAPYRRKLVTFENELDRKLGAKLVEVGQVKVDPSQFKIVYEPHHPYADENGYVLKPNVNPLVEMMDMREAHRSYEANINVMDTARSMLQQTVQMLNN